MACSDIHAINGSNTSGQTSLVIRRECQLRPKLLNDGRALAIEHAEHGSADCQIGSTLPGVVMIDT